MTTKPMNCATDTPAENRNLVASEQWDASWATISAPLRLRPWRDYVSWRFARLFREYIKPGQRVLEVGCGGSRFLPYFAKDLGAEVWGFDYTPAGVASTKAALRRAGVEGTILQADLFAADEVPTDYFDVVFSGGFIEHFEDTDGVVNHIVQFAKPGSGLVITEIPHVTGWMFRSLQRRLDQTIFDQHIPVTAEAMDSAHVCARAEVVRRASGFGSLGIGVLNYNRVVPAGLRGATRRCLEIPQTLLTAPLWLLRSELESDTFSPFLVGVYRRNGH
jgi:2-polyprenyl-3-methyl-5-hydroxy-6-metoxy-1,4-benzoquinol methylase